MNRPKVIKTEADYREALAHLETLMDAAPNSPAEEELELLAVLIEEYEKDKCPIGLPDPIEAIKFRMEQQGLTRKDLVPYIGSQSKVSEVLNGKRPLSLSMIRNLEKGLGIPAEVLLQTPGQNPPGTTTTEHYKLIEGAILLDPDVRPYFPDSESVNTTLRSLIKTVTEIPALGKRYTQHSQSAHRIAEK
jgi:HTH-type transcriptional regulator/antitoxin HigA